MRWAIDNPDRNFSADVPAGANQADLRDLLRTSEMAEYFGDAARMRIGQLISKAKSGPAKLG